ncbi:MAG: LamG domain-containing protein [Verrucomicrobia bacterium]|nr:LamG domain-containing protein [Verrucomicrobiota bacterium]MBT7066058.1 LamG domain-containing protein [Verrucomicrobiota bacterium]MBT7701503.1 LamG domain-containing protein [Verrucomicrobiota bacterium]
MNRLNHCITVVMLLSLTMAGWAEETTTNSVLRLSVDLVDGSHVIGVPTIESVPVQTPYAKMTIPLATIRSFTIEDDHETASFDLQNGDRLKGVVNLAPLELSAMFGTIFIGMEHVTRINVSTDGSSGRPILHYSFDRDEGNRVTDQSGHGHDGVAHRVGYEESIKGKGIRTSSSDSYVTCASPDLSLDGWRQLTVATWFKVSSYATYGRIFNRGNVEKGGAFSITVGGTYGGKPQKSVFSVRLNDGKSVAVRLDRFAELNKWYHIAGVYDGRTAKYYINGEVAGTTDVSDDARNATVAEPPGVDLMVGKCSVRRSWRDTHINGMLDEVMIFDRALNDTQVRQLYSSPK